MKIVRSMLRKASLFTLIAIEAACQPASRPYVEEFYRGGMHIVEADESGRIREPDPPIIESTLPPTFVISKYGKHYIRYVFRLRVTEGSLMPTSVGVELFRGKTRYGQFDVKLLSDGDTDTSWDFESLVDRPPKRGRYELRGIVEYQLMLASSSPGDGSPGKSQTVTYTWQGPSVDVR